MKRFFFVFLMVTSSVSLAEWERIGKNDNFVQDVDRATIRKKGKFVEMWDMKSHFETQVSTLGEKYKSSKSLQRYDCKNETKGLIQFVWYADIGGEGRVVYSENIKKNDIEDASVVPGSIGEMLLNTACGRE